MLLFISIRLVSSISAQSVSIHLMLLFISLCRQILLPDSPVSIHLMLLFIEKQRIAGESKGKFQYISCYSLSSVDTARSLVKMKFQYISCYSLSKTSCPKSLTMGVSLHLMLLFIQHLHYCRIQLSFQYISCYSLSAHLIRGRQGLWCFNTSHVTLYQTQRVEYTFMHTRFNTSHVTLYQKRALHSFQV